MTDSIQKQQPCWKEYYCFYRIEGVCTFQQQAGAILSPLREKRHKGSLRNVKISHPITLPCEVLDEEDLQHGIGDLFADLGP